MTPQLHQQIVRQHHAELIRDAELAALPGKRESLVSAFATKILGLVGHKPAPKPQPNVLKPV